MLEKFCWYNKTASQVSYTVRTHAFLKVNGAVLKREKEAQNRTQSGKIYNIQGQCGYSVTFYIFEMPSQSSFGCTSMDTIPLGPGLHEVPRSKESGYTQGNCSGGTLRCWEPNLSSLFVCSTDKLWGTKPNFLLFWQQPQDAIMSARAKLRH